MSNKKDHDQEQPSFPILANRFDQKNEMFKRARWDEKIKPLLKRLDEKVFYEEKPGYRKMDYALHQAAWNLERSFSFGNYRSNSGLYAWTVSNDQIRQKGKEGGPVRKPPGEMSRIIKKAALFFGAEMVGICRLHPGWVYSHEFNVLSLKHYPLEIPEGCHNAIVIAVAMDYEGIRSSPTAVAGGATGMGYSKMAFVANTLATFIRSMGYRALPCGNDTALSIPLAMAAGLGEWSRMGLLVTEEFGPRVRLCKVITDLPLEYDSYRPFGVVEFCKTCEVCAKQCPSRAIPEGDMTAEGPNISSHSGILKWYIDGEKCYSYWAHNRVSCSDCIRVCPFNQRPGKIHDLARMLIRNTTLFNRFLVRLHGILRYDRPFPVEKFWER